MLDGIFEKQQILFNPPEYDNIGKYKINADCVHYYSQEECYRERMVSLLPMLPLLKHQVSFEEADYILYSHFYARCEDYSDFVVKQLKFIANKRKDGAEIIVLGKAANAEKLLNGAISNITFWGDHYCEKLGKKFGFDICEQYFVYDETQAHLAIWPVDGCLQKCKFCRRSYMDIKFESLSLETIKSNLDQIKKFSPEKMKTVSLRAENLTEYGIDIYGKQMLHQLLNLLDSYEEIHNIHIPIGLCIAEITPEILNSLCSPKISFMYLNIETGSDRLLKFIGKKHNSDQVRHIFKKIHKENPTAQIRTTIMLGLPTENLGDVLDTAKLILEIKPSHIHCNYFICSPNSPLATYPQLTDSCKEHHLTHLIRFFRENPLCFEFSMDSYYVYPKPNSRKSIKERDEIKKNNDFLVKRGFLPRHINMDATFISKR